MKSIYLTVDQVPSHLREGNGRKYQVIIADSVTLQNTQWSGGTRYTYTAVDLATGATRPVQDPRPFPLQGTLPPITLQSGWAIRRHSVFCGKDMGYTFYLRAEDVAPLLPAPTEELNHAEKVVLAATCALKASYGGRKPRIDAAAEHGVDASAFETAKASLIDKGLLRKNGSVTPAGRNARPDDIRVH